MKKRCFSLILAVFICMNIAGVSHAAWSERTVYVKFFSQNDSDWRNDVMVAPYKMRDSGCVVTSVAQILRYYYIGTNPKKFNTWLKNNGGYNSKANIYWSAVSRYTGGKVVASYYTSNCWNKAKSEILSGRPCVIKTNLHGTTHWVVVRGYEKRKFTINDPWHTSFKLLQYGGSISAVVTFSHKVNPGLNTIFNECRTRNGGVSKVGYPVNYYHKWGSLTVRDFKRGTYNWCIMSYLYPNAGVRKCYLVRTGFWEKWRQLGGPYSFLGMPITDEYPSFKYRDAKGRKRARQDFADGGYMVWFGNHVRIFSWSGTRINAVQTVSEEPAKSGSLIASISPNPFNPSTRVVYSLPQGSRVNLSVYDVRGRKVRTLVDEYLAAGNHTIQWSGKNERNEAVTSGVYFVRLSSVSGVVTEKIVLLK